MSSTATIEEPNSTAESQLPFDVAPGDHVIALMSGRRDVDVLPAYLSHVEPVTAPGVVVAAPSQEAEVRATLEASDIEIPSEAIHFQNPLAMGLQDGEFDAERFLAATKEEVGGLIEAGAERIHHCGIMRWLTDAGVPEEECIYLEARINQEVEGSCMSGFCVYDVRHIGAHLLVQLLRTHPKVLLDDRVVENPFYVRPEDVLAELGRTS